MDIFGTHGGELAALSTAFAWAVSALSFEAAGRRVGSMPVNVLRLIVAFPMLSVVCWATRGLWLPTDASAHAWVWLGVSGVVGFGVGDLCLFRAFVLIGARLSSLVMTTAPALAVLFGWWVLGEELALSQVGGVVLIIVGIAAAIATGGSKDRVTRPSALGLLLAFGGAAGQALGLVLSKYGMGEYDPIAATQIRVLAGIVAFGALFSLLGSWRRAFAALHDPRGMAQLSLGALFGPVIGVSMSLVAVQRTEAGIAASLMALTPLVLIPMVWLVKRERAGWGGVVGAIVAVSGVTLLFWQ